mmetsp:Transcript_25991/g.44341  ORF Transcript_25991/g.44341 Transcript_25991/m.44341 type:complete len:82 (+) Transcript_25991:635-880(+)
MFIARRCSQDITEHKSTAAAHGRQQHSGSSTAAAEPRQQSGALPKNSWVGLLWSMRGMSPREATAHACASFPLQLMRSLLS